MRVLLHEHAISERGTTQAVFDYAMALKDRGHETTLVYPKLAPVCEPPMLKLLQDHLEVASYEHVRDLHRAGRRFDCAYFLTDGRRSELPIPGIRNVVHSVFQIYEPHGEWYGYISEWLAAHMHHRFRKPTSRLRGWRRRARTARLSGCETADAFPHIPHACDMSPAQSSVRGDYGVPENAFLILRYGGFETFDIDWVHAAIRDFLTTNSDAYFLGVNTRQFMSHPRAIFAAPVIDRQHKSDLLASADLFLHGRRSGESFGLSIVESLQLGLPVLAWEGGWDRNHVAVLSGLNATYRNQPDLAARLSARRHSASLQSEKALLMARGNEFRPQHVVSVLERALSG